MIYLVYFNGLRCTAHYMTVSQSINLNEYNEFNKLFASAI